MGKRRRCAAPQASAGESDILVHKLRIAYEPFAEEIAAEQNAGDDQG